MFAVIKDRGNILFFKVSQIDIKWHDVCCGDVDFVILYLFEYNMFATCYTFFKVLSFNFRV